MSHAASTKHGAVNHSASPARRQTTFLLLHVAKVFTCTEISSGSDLLSGASEGRKLMFLFLIDVMPLSFASAFTKLPSFIGGKCNVLFLQCAVHSSTLRPSDPTKGAKTGTCPVWGDGTVPYGVTVHLTCDSDLITKQVHENQVKVRAIRSRCVIKKTLSQDPKGAGVKRLWFSQVQQAKSHFRLHIC